MKKVILILLVLVLGTALTGCMTHTPTFSEPATPPGNSVAPDEKPPDDISWINPGKVAVGNFYPGARAESILLLYNGNAEETPFSVTCRIPDNVDDGYSMPPPEAPNWVTVDDPLPILAPKETKALLIVLEMPEEATRPPEKWQLWIVAMDASQSGMVREAMGSKWSISMERESTIDRLLRWLRDAGDVISRWFR